MASQMLYSQWCFVLCILHFCTILEPVQSIQCFECVHNNQRVKRQQRYVYPCSEFDRTDRDRYVMNCPDSKMCIYQKITLALSTDQITVTTMDGCTPNTTDTSRYAEAELLQEGCVQHTSAFKPPTSEYCYCGNDFCNSAIRIRAWLELTVLTMVLQHVAVHVVECR